jgi:aminopeptidase N
VGRPGVHEDGDGSTEGWFRSHRPAGDGGFVTTEPVGTEDWMPLNDHPSAKPTYDFWVTTTPSRTAVANGVLRWHRADAPTPEFPHGSTTWRWHMASPVPSYLVECSIGHFRLHQYTADGRKFYEVQSASLSRARRQDNLRIMKRQPGITEFESRFNGPFPFDADGVLVNRTPAGFEEEMEGMITFEGGHIDLDTLYHENMHQWWGDNVTEANYNLTFFKEGFATLGEFLFHARTAQMAAGGPSTASGRRAFNAALVRSFDDLYGSSGLWSGAPSDPTPYRLFSSSSTYNRPGIGYIALRQILGGRRFVGALRSMQRRFGGRTITESQLEVGFRRWMPNRSETCATRLHRFFRQWFDTSYPTGNGAQRPVLTGPGLHGGGFYNRHGGCS